jgi:hypothetical protein
MLLMLEATVIWKPIVLAAVVALLVARPSIAQTVEEKAENRNLDRVLVDLVDSTRDIQGRLLGLNLDSVIVLLDAQRVIVPLAKVRRVDIGGDPVGNGALIGGVVAGVWCAFICGQGLGRRDRLMATVVANSAIGVVIGAGIDAANSNRRTIYSAPKQPRSIDTRRFHPAFRVMLRF